jgi:hypothetical protein
MSPKHGWFESNSNHNLIFGMKFEHGGCPTQWEEVEKIVYMFFGDVAKSY